MFENAGCETPGYEKAEGTKRLALTQHSTSLLTPISDVPSTQSRSTSTLIISTCTNSDLLIKMNYAVHYSQCVKSLTI